jgi:pilus assembly protein CpaB
MILLVFGFLFINALLQRGTAPPVVPTVPPPITAPVVVTTRSLPIRALLKAEDLTVVQMPVEFVPLDAVSEIEAAIGQITKIALGPGEMVLGNHLADPTNIAKDLAFIIGDDQVIMAVPINNLMSQINILQPGDLVDILVSINQSVIPANQTSGQEAEAQEELFTFDAMQHVEISAIVVEIVRRSDSGSASGSSAGLPGATPAPSPPPPPSEFRPQAIVLALAPQDALALKHLQDAGGVFDVVLRAPTSAQNFELSPVTSEYLQDRYELVIQR